MTKTESLLTNARDWTIESDDTLAVLVGVAYDIGAEDIYIIWFNDFAIGRGVQDLPCRVNAIFLDERCNAICSPFGSLVCLLCATWDIGGGEFRWEYF